MLRRSSRLQSKAAASARQSHNADEQQPKRRRMEEVEHREDRVTRWRQQYKIQNQFLPISHNLAITSSCLVPTGSSSASSSTSLSTLVPAGQISSTSHHQGSPATGRDGDILQEEEEEITEIQTTPPRHHTIYRFQNHFLTPDSPDSLRRGETNPLPLLDWADHDVLWTEMLKKEDKYQHSPSVMAQHSKLQPAMRAVLMEWLMEVCQLHTLQKETYYLAVDYIDRYLLKIDDVQPSELQLIGITALFLASKVEEIYPPKMSEYAFLTAEACTEDDMKHCEVVMLKVLNWDLVPVTVNTWLVLYLQLIKLRESQGERMRTFPQNIHHPCYSVNNYLQAARLLDLCMLDVGCLTYKYSLLAASAVYHVIPHLDTVLAVTGVENARLQHCVQWMAPFATVLQDVEPQSLPSFPDVKLSDAHRIQCHTIKLKMLDKAFSVRERKSGGPGCSSVSLTPPASDKKHVHAEDTDNEQR